MKAIQSINETQNEIKKGHELVHKTLVKDCWNGSGVIKKVVIKSDLDNHQTRSRGVSIVSVR